MDCSLRGSSVHGDSPSENTGVGCHFLLQGIFPTQGSNLCLLCLLCWQAGSLPLAPPTKSSGVGSHSLLQGTFPTQGTNSGLQHCKQLLYHLCHWGAECVMEPLVHFNLPYTLVNLVKSHLKCAFLLKFSYVTPFWGDAGIWWPESLVKGKRVLGSLLGAFQEQLGRLWP